MIRILTDEALAYLRLGLLMPSRSRLLGKNGHQAKFGIVFVPGVGANASQFSALERSVLEEADFFDAFEYFSLRHPRKIAGELHRFLEEVSRRCERYLVIGHSLGGLLLRMVLQSEQPPPGVAGYVSICAPLCGTWRSKLAPSAGLRALRPDSPLMQELDATRHRLDRWKGQVLTVGARYDQFIHPHTSAFIDGHDRLELDRAAHAGSLFDPRLHHALTHFARRLSAESEG